MVSGEAQEFYPIAVVQYERADFSVGQEEQLHWALIVLKGRLNGPCWQVCDKHYSDGRATLWELFNGKDVQLNNTDKCLGGVIIGAVKKSQLPDLTELLGGHSPIPKFGGWNCRDWVIEAVKLLAQKGCASKDVVWTQQALLPYLKKASVLTRNHVQNEPALVKGPGN